MTTLIVLASPWSAEAMSQADYLPIIKYLIIPGVLGLGWLSFDRRVPLAAIAAGCAAILAPLIGLCLWLNADAPTSLIVGAVVSGILCCVILFLRWRKELPPAAARALGEHDTRDIDALTGRRTKRRR